jgi:hypothetical protein
LDCRFSQNSGGRVEGHRKQPGDFGGDRSSLIRDGFDFEFGPVNVPGEICGREP